MGGKPRSYSDIKWAEISSTTGVRKQGQVRSFKSRADFLFHSAEIPRGDNKWSIKDMIPDGPAERRSPGRLLLRDRQRVSCPHCVSPLAALRCTFMSGEAARIDAEEKLEWQRQLRLSSACFPGLKEQSSRSGRRQGRKYCGAKRLMHLLQEGAHLLLYFSLNKDLT